MYDLIIIGGGPAGYTAALKAASSELRVLLFECDSVGGVCLNRGCVPTKFWAHASEMFVLHKELSRYGIASPDYELDFSNLQAENYRIVKELREQLYDRLLQNGIEVIKKSATILSKNSITDGEKLYETRNILIATGSEPNRLGIPGEITSNELLSMNELPNELRIIGGGVIGVEFAYILSNMGVKITLYQRSSRILSKWDRDISRSVQDILKKNGVRVITKYKVGDEFQDKARITLTALGRKPHVDDLGLEKIGINCATGIEVDSSCQTNISGVFAAGDVISGSCMLAHAAMEQGERVVAFILKKEQHKEFCVPECIYLEPEIAQAGMTAEMAKEQGVDVLVFRNPMTGNARTMISSNKRSFIKIVADATNHTVLGAQIMCERATDMIELFVMAIDNKMTVQQMSDMIYPHPSFCEGIADSLRGMRQKYEI